MSRQENGPQPNQRICHMVKRPDFDGYGFNLHSEKGKVGQYIGKVDKSSPAEDSGLRQGDRIIEVNGVNIGNETHKEVVKRIKAISNEVVLLVIDPDAEQQQQQQQQQKGQTENLQNEENKNVIAVEDKDKIPDVTTETDKVIIPTETVAIPSLGSQYDEDKGNHYNNNNNDINANHHNQNQSKPNTPINDKNQTNDTSDTSDKSSNHTNVPLNNNNHLNNHHHQHDKLDSDGDDVPKSKSKSESVVDGNEESKKSNASPELPPAVPKPSEESPKYPHRQDSPTPSSGGATTNNEAPPGAGLNLSMTAAELRAKLLSRKKYDPKAESIDLRKKFDIIQKL